MSNASSRFYSRRLLLSSLVIAGGAGTMGVEMCASRLLAPYFGNSLPVWGILIGLLLAYLAVGYFIGGRLADRQPREALLYRTAAWSGFLIGLIPQLSRPILRYSAGAFARYEAGAVLGSLLGVAALFAVPVVLLGCIPPFALRLSVKSTETSGIAAGRIYSLSTIGSLIGTFGTVFVFIPNLGTRRTIVFISALLLGLAFLGLLQHIGRRALAYLVLLAAIVALQLLSRGAIKPGQSMIYETESAYNYIQVVRDGEEVVLRLNEGEGIQSAYHPRQVLTGYVYDYFLLVPFFRNAQMSPPVSSLCLIGLGAGTAARQYTAVFGEVPIDGVEIDPAIVDAGMRFFDLRLPNLQVVVADGRYYLSHSGRVYDAIIVDAYRPPYIPFHLTTLEFFGEVRDHLAPDGVVAVNVARTESDYALVDAIASTLKAIYPSVYIMDALGNLNSVVIATQQPTRLYTITTRLSELRDPVLQDVALRAAGRVREFTMPNSQVLTDDQAPVEQIVHSIAARFLLGQQQVQEVHQ